MRPKKCKTCGKMQVGGLSPADVEAFKKISEEARKNNMSKTCPYGYTWDNTTSNCVPVTTAQIPRPTIEGKPSYSWTNFGDISGKTPAIPAQPAVNNTPVNNAPSTQIPLVGDCPTGYTKDETGQCVEDNGYDPSQEKQKGMPITGATNAAGEHVGGTGAQANKYGFQNANPNEPPTKEPEKKDNWWESVFMGMRGTAMGARYLSNKRKQINDNKYDYAQHTALGQMNPMPVSQFQYSNNDYTTPNNMYMQAGGMMNPYSYYARYGGNLKGIIRDYNKWTNDAEMDMTDGYGPQGKPMKMGGGFDLGDEWGKSVMRNLLLGSMKHQYGKKKSGGLTPNKAREILHDGTIHGHPITDKQRRFFGAMSKGNTMHYPKHLEGGELEAILQIGGYLPNKPNISDKRAPSSIRTYADRVTYKGDTLTDNQIEQAVWQQMSNSNPNSDTNSVIAGAYDYAGDVTRSYKRLENPQINHPDILYYNLSSKDKEKMALKKQNMGLAEKTAAWFWGNGNYLPSPNLPTATTTGDGGGGAWQEGGQLNQEDMILRRGGNPAKRHAQHSQQGQGQQIMQLIQMYAQMSGKDPRQIMQALKQMQPQQQQQALQQMAQAVQQAQQQQQQPQQQQMQQQGMPQQGQMMQGDSDQDMMKEGGHWLQGAVNPAHKGWCTPLSNPHCTGRRRQFALMMKKNHGFHD